jgi:hypothetical protein
MAKYEEIKDISDEDFKRLSGINRDIFKRIVAILQVFQDEKSKKGGRKPKLSMEDKVLMLMEYYREYRTYFHISKAYGLSESNTYTTIKWMELKLINCPEFHLAGKKDLLQDGKYNIITVDATETPIQRPKKNKKNTTQEKRKDIH